MIVRIVIMIRIVIIVRIVTIVVIPGRPPTEAGIYFFGCTLFITLIVMY